MKLVDSHQHLWDKSRFPYSWCAGIPALNRSFLPADYNEAAAGARVVASVHVEADIDDGYQWDETRWISELAEHPDCTIRGIVAALRPEEADFSAQLERLKSFPLVVGVRRVLHVAPDDLAAKPLFAENVRRLADYGLSFDLCVLARQLPVALRLVEQCPEVSFILDHCGVPDVKGGVLDPWRDDLTAIAAHPNVACKISGLVAYADPDNWSIDDLRSFFDHAAGAFGWDRVMWGSDWPVCNLTASYQQWLNAALELTANESEENRAKLFHDNALRIYRLTV